VLPIENSYQGDVAQVMDMAFAGSLYINGVYDLEVTQNLLALPGTRLSDITEVISHPQALGQCAEYIRRAGFDTEEYSNTAEAARLVAEMQDRSVAAIASREAAERFSLSVLDHDINSQRNNTTRFAVFSRTSNADDDKSKALHSILLFTVRNEAGSLARALDVIGSFGFNMRTLRSRPMKELLWEYYFYIEVEGNIQTERGQSMLEGLSPFCDKLKFAGTYKKI
jgi:chorismate mutase/prephenate dehydratase